MKTPPTTTLVCLAALALCGGCATATGPFVPLDTTKYTLEYTDKFLLLDQPAQHSVTCTGLNQMTLGDGRLEVVANVKNRESRRVEVQINCVFKDDNGFANGDETPWQTLILSENSTEAVRFTAMNTSARKYTVRIRQAR
ncbi:MAG TPA: YcfL family protein [Opitutaceae bacterium]|nr:YcfL family protein [Opitutaceae bacterium]